MSHLSLSDFFRPDHDASNRALKKYLEEEGVSLGFRDLLSLRAAADTGIYFSYAFLEAWSAGEFTAAEVSELTACKGNVEQLAAKHEWSWVVSEGLFFVGLSGELVPEPTSESAPESLRHELVPLRAVYGTRSLLSAPGAGGAWKEEELQQASLTLLDGESEEKLVEAFRHLFRAAPTGSARAAVVATALSRHRAELNREVADKLEELSPPLGKALRQLFTPDESDGVAALSFLLGAEASPDPPAWVSYWSVIRGSVLESLVREESGRQILVESLPALEAVARRTDSAVLTPRLVDALLAVHDHLSAAGRPALMSLLEMFLAREPSAEEMLQSRLELSTDIAERIFLGETLRRQYQSAGREDSLHRLRRRFANEALSVGSTAGSLALAELLGAFGPSVLSDTALSSLENLSDRQTLNAMAMWEQLANDRPEFLRRVAELFVNALTTAEHHWGLLLKSSLLSYEEIYQAFLNWCAALSVPERRRLVLVGQNWTLTTENRPLVAQAVCGLDWEQADVWENEWRRTTLSFQKLSWLAQCLVAHPLTLSSAVENRIMEHLTRPPRNLYFWDLMRHVASFPTVSLRVPEAIVVVAHSMFRSLEAGLEEEKEALLAAAGVALSRTSRPAEVLREWSGVLKSGVADDLAWIFGLIRRVFEISESPFVPERLFVASLLQRLFQSGPDSMQQALKAALDEHQEDLRLPTVMSLEVQNLGFEALAAVAAHPGCPESLRSSVQRRLVLFLQQWGQDLARTNDLYSFRSTPLFALLEPLLDSCDPSLSELFEQLAAQFLTLQRQHPERFRLEVRQSAQSFFARWVEKNSQSQAPEVLAWRRVLSEL